MGFPSLLAEAEATSGGLKARAEEIESLRRVPIDIVDRLKESGAFSLTFPHSFGGPELTSPEQFEIIEAYARGNCSVAWCVMIGCDSGLYSARLDPEVARQIYPTLETVQAGWVMPIGKAERVPGGYRVSGRWMFGSGCQHADVLAAGCVVYENGGPVLENGEPMRPRGTTAKSSIPGGPRGWPVRAAPTTPARICSCRPSSRFNMLGPARPPGVLYASHEALLRKMSAVPIGCGPCRAGPG